MGFERNKKIIIRILIIIVVALIAFAGYIVITNNPKFKLKMAVSYVFDKTDSAMKLAEESNMANAFMDNKVEVTNRLTTKIALNKSVLDELGAGGKTIENFINSSTIETNVKSDVPNKYMDIGLNYSYNNEKINANAYLNNNEVYFLVKDYFDKYIKLDPKDFGAEQVFDEITSKVQVSDIRYMMDILKKSVVDGIEFGTINNSKVEIDVDEEKVSVNKVTLTIDTKLSNQIETIFLNKVLFDTKAKEIIIKLSDSETYPNVAALESDLRDELLKLEETTYDNEILGEYSIYTSGVFNKIVRNEFKYFDSSDVVLQYTTYKTAKFDTQVSFYEDNKLTMQSNIKELADNNYDITVTAGPDISMDIKGIINNTLIDVAYTLRVSGSDDVKGSFRLETKNISEKEINQTLNLKLDTPESYGTANLTIDSTIKIVDNIVKPDFSNNVNVTSLTDEQMANIMTNFQNKNPKLIQAISEIMADLMGGLTIYPTDTLQ